MLLCVPSKISKEGSVPKQNQYRVSESMNLDPQQLEIARRIEKRLRYHGFSDNMIMGAIANAHAESKLNPSAIGDKGKSTGIFQLNKNGLGKGMNKQDMHSVETSVDRVARAAKKSKRLMRAERNGASVEEHTKIFCEDVMRPSHKKRRARQRVVALKDLKKS